MRFREHTYEEEGRRSTDVDRSRDRSADRREKMEGHVNGDVDRPEEREADIEESEPCPMCGGHHRGSYCQMPPHAFNHVD